MNIGQELLNAAQAMSGLEIIAVVFGLLSVWLAKKENILVFPTGIISVLIYVYICTQFKLYADAGINAFYFIMSIYGWVHWSRKKGDDVLPIQKNNGLEQVLYLAITFVFFILLRFFLMNYTDSDVPQWDAMTTSIFLVAMILMALKKIENWIYWIIGDAIAVPLYFYKTLYLTSFQYCIFLAIAIAGYFAWRKSLQTQNSIAS